MAGGNGFYFAAAALLTSVVLGLLLYQSRWTASARGGGMFGHEGFAPDKRPNPADVARAMNLSWTCMMFNQASASFCSSVRDASVEVYKNAKGMAGGSWPDKKEDAMGMCGMINGYYGPSK